MKKSILKSFGGITVLFLFVGILIVGTVGDDFYSTETETEIDSTLKVDTITDNFHVQEDLTKLEITTGSGKN